MPTALFDGSFHPTRYRAAYHYEISIIILEIDVITQSYENCSALLDCIVEIKILHYKKYGHQRTVNPINNSQTVS